MRFPAYFLALVIPVLYAEIVAADNGSRSFIFHYNVAVEDIAGAARVWIPVPQTTQHQKIGAIYIDAPGTYSFVTDPIYGNRFALIEYDGPESAWTIGMAITVTRHVRRAALGEENSILTDAERERYLAASRIVPIDGAVREEALRVAGDAATNAEKARRLYDHIVDTVNYDKSGEGWGRGDALYACNVRMGNCTDFHSLFIGEARALGVPARFMMGFSVPRGNEGVISGYHCWAEYYDEETGWTPVDASEAQKDKSRRDELFGGLDADRVQFTMGRDVPVPGVEGDPFNFVIYPYAEVAGKTHDSLNYTFGYFDITDVHEARIDDWYGTSHPTDGELMEKFEQHEAGFQALLELVLADEKISRLDDSTVVSESGIETSRDRVDDYRERLNALGIHRGFQRDVNSNNVEFVVNTIGNAVAGSMKGYAYVQDPLPQDTFEFGWYALKTNSSITRYKPIKDNWYIVWDVD